MAEKDKKSSASFVPFRPLDNLFEPTVPEQPAPAKSGLTNLPVDDLYPFKDHPFRQYTEEKMAEMVESVQEHGVITPILVRPRNEGDGYEIISGHNRVEKRILLTFSAELDDDPVRSLAKELGMAVQSLYEQRKVIAKRVHNYVTNEDLLELFGYEDQRDLGEAILNYIATLPPDEKALLLVTRYGEKTADEIAKERGIARRTVFNEKRRLVKRIAKTVRKQATK